MKELIRLNVNGEVREAAIMPYRTLLEALREDLGLTGTKAGCDDGSCGACTVLVNGEPTLSCIMLAFAAEGAQITTIEGLARNGQLDRVQRAFLQEGGMQCGYCTPGMIMAVKALVDKVKDPSDEQIRLAISNNICRCTGYTKIVEAARKAAHMEEFVNADINAPQPTLTI